MKKSTTIMKRIGLALLAIIVLSCAVAAMQPGDFRYERSISINATPDAIFPYLNDLHKGQEWSPWAKLDPNATDTFNGPQEGVGASMHWDGNKDVGSGTITQLENTPDVMARYKLEFERPMAGVNTVDYVLKQENGGTTVTWSMYGPCNFKCKAIGLVMNCKKMVEEQFDQGLSNLKSLVEAESP